MLGVVHGVGTRHREYILAVLYRIIGRAGFGVAAITARRFFACGLKAIGRLDLRKINGLLAQTEKLGLMQRQFFPLEVLRNRDAARTIWGAIGHGILAALEKGLHVIGGSLTMVHGHDNGGAAERAITGGEYLRVICTHAIEIGAYTIGQHHSTLIKIVGF